MGPAVLADLVGRVHVNSLSRTQSPHEIATQLRSLLLILMLGFKLPQSLVCSADYELAHAHMLATKAECIKRFADGRGLGYGVSGKVRGHPLSVAPRAAP